MLPGRSCCDVSVHLRERKPCVQVRIERYVDVAVARVRVELTQFPARRLQHERCVSRGDAVAHSSFCGGCPSLAEGECRVMVSVCLRSFDG